jgi:PTS system mannose-specific IID component
MSDSVLTKRDVSGAFWRWFFCSQISFNYETMQSPGVIYSLGPSLEKICAGKPELLKSKLRTHFQFFNTQTWLGGTILGAVLGIEESGKENASETATAIKTSLMGPFAGLGDSLFYVLFKTIFGAIAAYMALEGSPIGVIMCLLIGWLMVVPRYKLWGLGYNRGVEMVTKNQKFLTNLTEAASIMGLVVVGALIASTVSLATPLTFSMGEATATVQSIFDRIMPKLLPVAVTMITYWALGKKKMTSTKMILIMIAAAIIGVLIKIF